VNLHTKVTHAAQGPNATAEYSAKITPTIPTLQAIKTTFARAFPTSKNGNRHSSPDKWSDINALVSRYQEDRLTFDEPDLDDEGELKTMVRPTPPTKDVLVEGVKALSSTTFLADWTARRSVPKSDLELWTEDTEEEVRTRVEEMDDNGRGIVAGHVHEVEVEVGLVVDQIAAGPGGGADAVGGADNDPLDFEAFVDRFDDLGF
jgi:hypothetical protein